MTNNIKSISFVFIGLLMGFSSCKKESYTFGDIKTPSSLVLTTAIAGADGSNPNGNGTGTVVITTTSSNAITYSVNFGDGKTQLVPSGTITYKYTNPGTADYTISVSAIGKAGTSSTISQKITVFVAFEIPSAIVAALTNGSSKTWVCDKDASGHIGIGDAAVFEPAWYSADPNSKDPSLYDDEITFTKDALGNISLLVDNKGTSFIWGDAVSSYGYSGAEGAYALSTAGSKKLSFMDATSGAPAAISTRIQFVVPGNGVINFATGGNTYEILSISSTNVYLRNIGLGGWNAWYQKLKIK
jgi:hypothetical protein